METEITQDWIDRYNDNELTENERAIFQKRMREDRLLRNEVYVDACLNKLLKDSEIQDLMKKIGVASKRNADGSRMMDMLLVIAAIFCIAMMLGIWYMLKSDSESKPRYFQGPARQLNQKKSVKTPASPDIPPLQNTTYQGLMKKNFESLAEFEFLIGLGTPADQFKLFSPGINAVIHTGAEIRFAWQDNRKISHLTLVILNNQGIPISKASLKNKNFLMLQTAGFKEGLYYWKIMADEKMIIMGKFTIL